MAEILPNGYWNGVRSGNEMTDQRRLDVIAMMTTVPEWASKVMLNSLPMRRFSWARLWAHFRLNVHCGLKLHRPVVVTLGNQFYCGCGDCEFYPRPIDD